MKIKMLMLVAIVALSGCTQFKKLTGTEEKKKEDRPSQFYVVSCCMDNASSGTPTYPTFLPQSHVDLCKRARTACHDNDCQIDGDTYLPMGVDCGRYPYKIGDQYYPPTGY